MGKWSTILGIGKKVANHSATQTTARSIGGALVHPQRTLVGLGNATKTAVMGGGMGYLAWEKLVNDKPIVRAAADLLVGEEAVDKGLEMAGNATNKIADAADKAGESLQDVSQSVSSMRASSGGVGTFLRNMTGGNGMECWGTSSAISVRGTCRDWASSDCWLLPCWYSDASVGLERLPGRYWA